MIIGVVSRNPSGWASQRLVEAIESLGHKPLPFRFRDMVSYVDSSTVRVYARDYDLSLLNALIVRPLGRCSLDIAVLRMDILYALERLGVRVVNPPDAIEKAIDKYRALYILSLNNIPVPKTVVSENPNIEYRWTRVFRGKPVVVKPIFGSRGMGSTRISDRETIWRILQTLAYNRLVLYVQEFIEHGGRDMRLFVIGDRVVAAMYREHPGLWKTNIAQGARPVAFKPSGFVEELAIKSARALGCLVAGVDIVETRDEYYVLEVNSQPGWRGLQTVTRVDIAREIVRYVVGISRR